MKIPITINGKKYSVRPIADLSTGEFLEFAKVKNPDIMKYIAFETKTKHKDAFFAVISPTVEKSLGKIPDVSKLKRPALSYIDYSKSIETVGQRHQIEDSNLKGYDLLVFTLAVSQAQSMNIDDVNKLKDEYLKKPFLEILPAGFFFLKKSAHGRNNVVGFFAKRKALTAIRRSKRRLEKIN